MGRKSKLVIEGKLVCSRCSENLPTSLFQRDSAKHSGFAAYCRICAKFKKLKSRYGLNREEAELMAEIQDETCAICEKEAQLVLDHCHKTLKPRGFLCSPCNKGLGFFRDQAANLRRAAEYLEKQCYTKKLLTEH